MQFTQKLNSNKRNSIRCYKISSFHFLSIGNQMMSNVYQASMIHCNMNIHHQGPIGKCFNYGLRNDACGLWRHLYIFFSYLFRSIWSRSTFNNSTLLEKRIIFTMVLSYALCLNEKKKKQNVLVNEMSRLQ